MNYSENTLYIKELANKSDSSNHIVPEMYSKHDVKRGLRDINGNGVVAGLTAISVTICLTGLYFSRLQKKKADFLSGKQR